MNKKYTFRVCMNTRKTFSVMVQNFVILEDMRPEVMLDIPPINLLVTTGWETLIAPVASPVIDDLATLNYYESEMLASMGSYTLQDLEYSLY